MAVEWALINFALLRHTFLKFLISCDLLFAKRHEVFDGFSLLIIEFDVVRLPNNLLLLLCLHLEEGFQFSGFLLPGKWAPQAWNEILLNGLPLSVVLIPFFLERFPLSNKQREVLLDFELALFLVDDEEESLVVEVFLSEPADGLIPFGSRTTRSLLWFRLL